MSAKITLFLLFFCLNCADGWALRTFELVSNQALYGATRWVVMNKDDTLLDIARDYDLGYNQITAANPGVDPWLAPKDGKALVPGAFLLPQDRLSVGIVVNLAEMRLYYFNFDGASEYVFTAPVGVGREGLLTELGVYTIKSADIHPTWYVPESIRTEDPELPAFVPPGPDNPLGDYIFRLSRLSYGIHGTNKPWGVGRRVSHGCIRLYPEDIATLFRLVPVGSMVRITYEPIKAGWSDGRCWLQVFEDFDNRIANPLEEAVSRIKSGCEAVAENGGTLDMQAVKKALAEKKGIPLPVSTAPVKK
jgi:L,D-transpeptidase ErfK/SrfK